MDKLEKLSFQEVVKRLERFEFEHFQNYRAMYSSWLGGIVTDPALMVIPLDDHMVHRGDGVFEALKCVRGKIYLLEEHLNRLHTSAEMIQLERPLNQEDLKDAILQTIRASGVSDCTIRLYISRGPGDFSPRPDQSIGSQLYIVITDEKPKDPQKYEKGCLILTSSIPVKKTFFANVKSCNYLPNVLMKKEAVDAGVDYTISIDEKGFIGEGGTENIGIISKENEFLVPGFDRILRGTTLVRIMDLARRLVDQGELKGIRQTGLRPEDAYQAREMLIFGTTTGVLPAVMYDGRTIGTGKPGKFQRLFQKLLTEDMTGNDSSLTPVYPV
ncbi:MAG: aminotransferase class IV [Desulfohalobiaceae bacterium]|nr:aminotransferase class IV [Desulfohalobiaceae bacterium]